MSMRGTALVFFALAVLLFIGRKFIHHLSAAILIADNSTLTSDLYKFALETTTTYSSIPEIIALFLGIVFFAWSISKKE